MKKRGQVTTFIIIGIVLILLIASFFAIYHFYIKSDFEQQLTMHSEIPRRLQPISESMDECVKRLTKEAIDTMGIQGGYITLPEEPMPTTPFTPLSSSLEIIPKSDLRTALWSREKPNGIITTQIPTEGQMEREISLYIVDNFNSCLLELEGFEQQGFTIYLPPTTPIATVNLLEDAIQAQVHYPIEVQFEDINAPIENHFSNYKTQFGTLFNLAKQIFTYQQEESFLENRTIDMMVAYDSEIPFSGMNLDCTPSIWSKTQTIKKLKQALRDNIAAIKIINTDYKLQKAQQKYFEEEAIKGAHKDTNVNLMYFEDWPTVVEITPSEGDILKSSTFTNKLGSAATAVISQFTCLNHHHFIYTIKYPVLISLTNDDGSSFQFATQVLIDKNQGKKSHTEIPENIKQDSPICDHKVQDIEIQTVTYINDQEVTLPSADVSIKCYPANCQLGTTSRDGTLKTKSPMCFNGIVEATKKGYHLGKTYEISTNRGPQYVKVNLEKLHKKPLRVLVIDKDETREPYESEEIYMTFVNPDLGYQTYVTYPEQQEVELIAGNYEIKTMVMGESTWPITTQKQELENCIDIAETGLMGLFGATEEKCFKTETEKMELDYAVKGGVNFEYYFSREELGSEAPLTVYTIAQPITSDLNSMLAIQEQIDLNELDPRFRYPTT